MRNNSLSCKNFEGKHTRLQPKLSHTVYPLNDEQVKHSTLVGFAHQGEAVRRGDAVDDDAPVAAAKVAELDPVEVGVGPEQNVVLVVDDEAVRPLEVAADEDAPPGAVQIRSLDPGRVRRHVSPKQIPGEGDEK